MKNPFKSPNGENNPSPSKIPDHSELVIGWRAWQLDKERGRLLSCAVHSSWPFRKAIEVNDPNWHQDKLQPAGIHAYKFRRNAPYYANGGMVGNAPSIADPCGVIGITQFYVIGSIFMWGRVIEHTEGFRSEFAYPREIFVPEECDPVLVMKLEDNYGVPVNFTAEISWTLPVMTAHSLGFPTTASTFAATIGMQSLQAAQNIAPMQQGMQQAYLTQSIMMAQKYSSGIFGGKL